MQEMITKESGVLTAKFQAAEFVRTALDLEVRVHTLKELANRCRSKGNDAVAKARNLCSTERVNLDKASKNVSIKEQQRHKIKPESQIEEERKSTDKQKNKINSPIEFLFMLIIWYFTFIAYAFIYCLMAAAAFVVLGLCMVLFFKINDNLNAFFESNGTTLLICTAVVSAVVGLVVFLLFISKRKRREKKQAEHQENANKLMRESYRKMYEDEYQEALRIQRNAQGKLNNALAELRRAEYVAKQLNSQAVECETKAKQINETLQKGYVNTNIVPPDYRYIDCVIVLDHVFRNDLADTMRQAIFYYEEKKFRDLVLRGVNSIFLMLKNMANTMNDVKNMLNKIERKVSDISYDVMSVAENQYRSNELQQENLKVNKARQYAEECFYESQRYHNAYVESKLG